MNKRNSSKVRRVARAIVPVRPAVHSSRHVGERQGRVEFMSHSPEETQRLGYELAQSLPVPGMLLLRGSLGTGKTTLARGVAEGLGVRDGSEVNSPSFTLVNIYHGRCPIYHVDLYRLSGESEIRTIGLEDFMGLDGITIIEWSDRLEEPMPSALEVELQDAGNETRRIRIKYPSRGRMNLPGHRGPQKLLGGSLMKSQIRARRTRP